MLLRTSNFASLPRLFLINSRLCSRRLPAVISCLPPPSVRQFTAIASNHGQPSSSSSVLDAIGSGRKRPAQLQLVRGKKDEANLSALFKPVPVRLGPGEVAANTGDGLCGQLDKGELLKLLNRFTQKRETKALCADNGLDTFLQQQAFSSFRRFCIEEHLPVDLHIIVADILQGAGHVDDIFPYFLRHARKMFPHLECMDDLRNISDLSTPDQWYPEARRRQRRIVFHAGPTNSGKTYHAMQRFMAAKSGVYCGPLKLLATEVFQKCNRLGTVCDLVTGEERRFGRADGEPSAHVACTVEMASISQPYEVAVIDEIQLLRDPGRGWAWTRAFQGLLADEVHVCGEAGAGELLRRLCAKTGEVVEQHQYERLTELTVEPEALQTLDNVQPGDCVVCFSKNDIYAVSREIEARGKEVAVIYGGLPPGTKMAQAEKFNDPANPCKVMVATDAIGMGLNLSIRRIIFYSLVKPSQNDKGERVIDVISVSAALQIAGRAGRFGTQWPHGYVTTYRAEDLRTLRDILGQSPEPLLQAGLHPTADQIEQYAYHLPSSTLSNLMDIFVSLSTVDDALYFMCNMDDFKFLAEMIQHVPLALRARYVFCCAPINRKMPFVCTMFLKCARQFSRHEPVTFDWLVGGCGWPFARPRTILELVQLEAVFDVLDLYLWLSYRFVELFPHAVQVRAAQAELDQLIQQGVFQITRLLQNTEKATAAAAVRATNSATVHRDSIAAAAAVGGGGKGRLTDRLLAQGLLTPSMLNELQSEWNRAGAERQMAGAGAAAATGDQRKSAPKPTTTTARRKRKT